jgi:thimet oligopeptidase
MSSEIFKKCCVGMMVIKLFPISVEEIEKRANAAIEEAKKSIDVILKIELKDRSFANTADAFDKAKRNFEITQNSLWVVKNVYPDEKMRSAAQKNILKLASFSIDNFLSVDLYKTFNDYYEKKSKQETLNSEQRYFLEEVLTHFKRSGLHLASGKLEKIKVIQKGLSDLSAWYATNIASDNRSLSVGADLLEGVDSELLKGLARDKSGNCFVTTDYPTYSGVMKHCSVSSTRRDLFRVFNNRAYPKNKDVLEKIISSRDKLAKLLEFESYSSYDIANQMAKNVSRVESFLSDLKAKIKNKETKEIAMLFDKLPPGVFMHGEKIQPWDLGFVRESYIKNNYNLDDRKIAEYFPVQKTIHGIFSIYQQFLGLEFKFINEKGLWHKDVLMIEVRKKGNKNIEGYLLLDLYPREGKYKHACCESIVSPYKNENSVTVVVANFPKLLKHDDVVTFFHEFGHAMHNLLGRCEMNWFAGYNTKYDFVEVPSQMFEQWMWDKGMIKKVSSHYKTGEPLPDDIIDKMIELKNLTSGIEVHRQCMLSKLSNEYFKSGEDKEVDKIFRQIRDQEILVTNTDQEDHFYAAFEHLDGYGARYYCYMWSLVYAHDLFDTIKKRGLLDEKMGSKLISSVLGKGGSVDPNILLRDFLGREPSNAAFLKSIGV